MIILGTPVVYHHRAAVARYQNHGGDRYFWTLYEGMPDKGMDLGTFTYKNRMFEKWPALIHKSPWATKPTTINKTIMVWPEEGSGIVIGKVRRMRGVSHRGAYEDPGYFNATDVFELYVVKHELNGMNYHLVPIWACQPLQLAT